MIFDTKNNINQYKGLNENLDTVIQYLMENDLNTLPLGKTSIDDINYIMIFDNNLVDGKMHEYEMHKEYGDLHITLINKELIYVIDVDNVSITQAYDDNKDAAMGTGDEGGRLYIDPQHFLIVFPNDAHSVNNYAGYNHVKKAVFKFKI